MEKRYQIFVSSTFVDLQEERQKVIQTLMAMDCIPAGMELFPAVDEEQWQFIRKVIDDCDYYLLIIGGRYGSLTAEGISYTEIEYDYAVERGIKVIALVHGAPEKIPLEKSEISPELRQKLEAFRTKVSTGRLVNFWSSSTELPGLVALSLNKTIKMYPAVGWMRANTVSNAALLEEINALRKRNEELSEKLANLQSTQPTAVPNLADGEDNFHVWGTVKLQGEKGSIQLNWDAELSWNQIIRFVGPRIMRERSEHTINRELAGAILKWVGQSAGIYADVDTEVFYTIRIHLLALGLIEVNQSDDTYDKGFVWNLTPSGKAYLLRVGSVKKASS